MTTNDDSPAPGLAPSSSGDRLPRRSVLQFFAGAGALLASGDLSLAQAQAAAAKAKAKGYGTDPDLTRIYKPGDVWPLTMTAAQKKAATAFADVLLPADEIGPAASALRVPDYLDEWVSAPYPDQQAVRPGILKGLDWLDQESRRRFRKSFADASDAQRVEMCNDICDLAKAEPEFEEAARFFQQFRGLAMGAYYATPEGWKAIGYVGNVALPKFDGPPSEILAKLGLKQTVE